MFKEILKIIPRLDNGDLNKMERSLTQRFGRIAKKFGKGLGTALMGGGIAGLALGLVDKLLNPLKETQEAIDRVLKQGDDIVTNAKQFGTTAGKLFKLQALAKSTGLDEDALYMLISKFQTSLAEAEADPKKQTSVRQFVGQADTAEAFFNFIQSLQKMDKNSQLLVQQEVFGEKQILKMADFLQTDFADQLHQLKARPSEEYTPGLLKLGGMSDLADTLEARRMLEDTLKKSQAINESMMHARNKQIQQETDRENVRIRNYHNLMMIATNSAAMLGRLEKEGLRLLNEIAPAIKSINDIVKKIPASRMLRGLFGGE